MCLSLIILTVQCRGVGTASDLPALLENLPDDAIVLLYVKKCSTTSLYSTKLYVTWSFEIASLVTYSEIR